MSLLTVVNNRLERKKQAECFYSFVCDGMKLEESIGVIAMVAIEYRISRLKWLLEVDGRKTSLRNVPVDGHHPFMRENGNKVK